MAKDVSSVRDQVERAAVGNVDSFTVETRILRGDETVIWVSATLSLARDTNGTPDHLVGLFDDITARKLVQRENDRFAAVLENGSDFVAVAKPDLQITYLNPAGRELVGLTSQERVRITSLLDCFAKEERTRVTGEILPALRQEDRWTGEVHFRSFASGADITVSCNAFAIRDHDGHITEIACISRDVREEKEASLALSESRSRFKRLVDSNIIGVFFYDGDRRVVEANDAFLRTIGVAREELRAGGLSLLELSPLELRAREERLWDSLAHQEVLRPVEKEFLRRDGSRVSVIVGAANFEGSASQGVAYVLDVSERKRIEVQLRENEAKFRKLIDGVPQIVFMADGDLGQVHYNQRWFDYTGLDMAQSQRWGWLDSVHPDDRDRVRRSWIEAVSGKNGYREEYLLRSRNDAYRWHLAVAAPHFADDGRIQFWFGSLTDIHDQKLAEQSLRRGRQYLETEAANRAAAWQEATAALKAANQELDAFCQSAAHDLRLPLREIELTTRSLAEQYGGTLDVRGQRYLDRLHEETVRLERLLEDLVRLSKVTRSELRKQEVDLVSIAERSIERLRRSDPDRTVTFRAQGPSRVKADPRMVATALDHLLSNAWKFTAGRSPAEIVFGKDEREKGRTTFFVRDNGVGFDMAAYDKLFGPFQRLHSPREFDGRGVGLATVRRIVHRHGGLIWAESAPGKGATFYFTLEDTVSGDR
jgi:PAS domain S-box-containing protein